MSYGFSIVNGPNAIPLTSDSIAYIFAAEQYLPGSGTLYAKGAAGRNVTVQSSGVGYVSPTGFSYTQADSGVDRAINIICTTDGYYRLRVDGDKRGSSLYGIQWANNSGKLTLSSDDFGYGFVGNATYTGTGANDPFLRGLNLSDGPDAGWLATNNGTTYLRRYQINTGSTANAPICFLQNRSDGVFFNVLSVSVAGGTTWDVWVAGVNWTNPPQIKCFSRLVGPGSGTGYGLKLLDSNGIRTWDSRDNMLVVSAVIDFPSAYTSGTGGIITKQDNIGHGVANPYILAQGCAYRSAQQMPKGNVPVSVSEWMNSYLVDGANIYRNSAVIPATYFTTAVGGLNVTYFNSLQAERYYLINGNYYP